MIAGDRAFVDRVGRGSPTKSEYISADDGWKSPGYLQSAGHHAGTVLGTLV
jgi:hypothetical protein